jgi:hypothetical protein
MLACVLALATLAIAPPAHAIQPLGGEIRVSQMGPDGNASFSAEDPAVAYNSVRDEYLAVWRGADSTPGELEIWGRLISGDGTPLGGEFRISDMGPDGNASFQALWPAVAFNPTANEYLVVWHADDTTDNEDEIYGQRLSALGAEVGPNDFRISDMGPDGNVVFDAFNAAVAFNAAANEYLVVWSGNTDDAPPATVNDTEIFAQRLSAAGAEVGANDVRISDMGPYGDSSYGADFPAVAVNGGTSEYLVVWDARETLLALDETEIFGQRLSGAGAELGQNDFRISDMGPDGDANYRAFDAAVAFNPAASEYLVAWDGGDDTPPLVDGESEIFAQRLSAAGAAVGANDFRISDLGPDGNAAFDPSGPKVAYNATANEYFVAWCGDDDTPPLVDNEREAFAQRLDAAGGQIGGNDVRISQAGPDGDATRDALSAAVAWGQARNEYLIVWFADDDLPGLADNEHEVYARRAGAIPAPPAPPPPPPGVDETDPVLALGGALRQRAVANRRLNVQVRCDETCTVTVRARIAFPGRLPAAAQARIALPRVTRQLAAGKRVTVTVPLAGKARRAVRGALAAGKRVTATVTVTARDAAGNTTATRRTVRIVG